MLIESWARLRPSGWRMQIVGPSENGHLGELRGRVDELGLADQWSFVESVAGEAKWRLLKNADLFILPTFSENFGIAVAESLAAGTPVITTTGAPWKGLLDHDCGWWVPPNEESLFHALQDATSQPRDVLSAMGSRGQRWVSQAFSWTGIAEQMTAAYRWILGEGEKPSCVRVD